MPSTASGSSVEPTARPTPRSASNRASACRRSRIVSRKARSVRAIAAISSGPPDGMFTARLPALRPFIAATSRRSGTAIEPRTRSVSAPPTSYGSGDDDLRQPYRRGCLRDDAVARRDRLGAQLGDDRGEQFIRLDAVRSCLRQQRIADHPLVVGIGLDSLGGEVPVLAPPRRGLPRSPAGAAAPARRDSAPSAPRRPSPWPRTASAG